MRKAVFLLFLVIVLAGCTSTVKDTNDNNSGGSEMAKPVDKKVEIGDKVKVDYIGRLENGEIFDQSAEGKPLEFTVGDGELIDGFEQGVIGMKEGEKKTVTIPPEKAYGERSESQVIEV